MEPSDRQLLSAASPQLNRILPPLSFRQWSVGLNQSCAQQYPVQLFLEARVANITMMRMDCLAHSTLNPFPVMRLGLSIPPSGELSEENGKAFLLSAPEKRTTAHKVPTYTAAMLPPERVLCCPGQGALRPKLLHQHEGQHDKQEAADTLPPQARFETTLSLSPPRN